MDHQETIWIKKEETDVLPDEPGLVFLEDPLKTEGPSLPIKPDPELKSCMDICETNVAPLGISSTNNFIKEDPGLSLEADETLRIAPDSPSPPSKRQRMKKRTAEDEVDDKREHQRARLQIDREKIEGRECRKEHNLEVQTAILPSLEELNRNQQIIANHMKEQNDLFRKYIVYQMGLGLP